MCLKGILFVQKIGVGSTSETPWCLNKIEILIIQFLITREFDYKYF